MRLNFINMCYHAAVAATYAQLENHYQKPFEGDYFPSFTAKSDIVGYHFNGFSFPFMPIIGSNKMNTIESGQWGLIPAWTNDLQQANLLRAQTLNAKSETVFEKPSFKNSIQRQRCLIPVTGFFEWQTQVNNTKLPHYIFFPKQAIFSLAGISADWFSQSENKWYKTFSILTTDANTLMAKIHNSKMRMPCILTREQEEDWVNPDLSMHELIRFFKPFDTLTMEANPISNIITRKSKSSNVPEVLKPIQPPLGDLFA